jgi:hypothetical protein
MEDNMEDVHADETREARHLLAAAFETVPDDPTAVDGLLRAVRRRHARRRRSRALILAGAAAAAAGTAAVALVSVTVAAAPPALAAVTGALSRAGSESFRMNLTVTIAPAQPLLPSPLHVTGELDLKRHLGQETISNGWRTLIVGGNAYTKILPSQTRQFGTGGKLWTETPLSVVEDELPYKSPGGRLAWDFNSNRPFSPQAVLALLNSDAKSLDDEGPVTGPGWTGTRYRFTVSHPQDTGGLVDSITCTMDVDRQGHIRHLVQTTVFAAGGKPGTAGKPTYTADFTFSDFGIRFSVTPPPASQTNPDIGVGALQF